LHYYFSRSDPCLILKGRKIETAGKHKKGTAQQPIDARRKAAKRDVAEDCKKGKTSGRLAIVVPQRQQVKAGINFLELTCLTDNMQRTQQAY
jgi:hypothetical protein